MQFLSAEISTHEQCITLIMVNVHLDDPGWILLGQPLLILDTLLRQLKLMMMTSRGSASVIGNLKSFTGFEFAD